MSLKVLPREEEACDVKKYPQYLSETPYWFLQVYQLLCKLAMEATVLEGTVPISHSMGSKIVKREKNLPSAPLLIVLQISNEDMKGHGRIVTCPGPT